MKASLILKYLLSHKMWAPKSNLFHFWKQFASENTFFYFYSCDSEIMLFMMEITDRSWSSSTVWNFQNLEIEVAALFMTVALFSTMLPHLRCCGLNQLQFAGCLVLETIWERVWGIYELMIIVRLFRSWTWCCRSDCPQQYQKHPHHGSKVQTTLAALMSELSQLNCTELCKVER